MRTSSGVLARLGAVIFSWGVVWVCVAGELRGVVRAKQAPATSESEAPSTPPTAWEIPLPLVPVAKTPLKPAKEVPAESLLVLIPKKPGKRPRAPLVVLDGSKIKPNPAFIALQDTVTFTAKQELTLTFTDEEKPLLVPKKKKVTKGFTQEGVYRFSVKESPALRGLVVVGAGVKTAEVGESFRVKNLEDGSWSAYLVTSSEIVYAGEVNIREQEEASLEIELP